MMAALLSGLRISSISSLISGTVSFLLAKNLAIELRSLVEPSPAGLDDDTQNFAAFELNAADIHAAELFNQKLAQQNAHLEVVEVGGAGGKPAVAPIAQDAEAVCKWMYDFRHI